MHGLVIVKPEDAEKIAQETKAVQEKEDGIMKDILEKGTYIRPWVSEFLDNIGCEIVE